MEQGQNRGQRSLHMKYIEYICTMCGCKEVRAERYGRPMPGRCPRKTGDKPHSWRRNRVVGQ